MTKTLQDMEKKLARDIHLYQEHIKATRRTIENRTREFRFTPPDSARKEEAFAALLRSEAEQRSSMKAVSLLQGIQDEVRNWLRENAEAEKYPIPEPKGFTVEMYVSSDGADAYYALWDEELEGWASVYDLDAIELIPHNYTHEQGAYLTRLDARARVRTNERLARWKENNNA